jgi:Flp pilus assembly protein TadG
VTSRRLSGFDRRCHRSGGQSLVEFALLLPVLLLLLLGLFDLGRVVYAQHTITQDSREAARAGIVPQVAIGGACPTAASAVAYAQCQYDFIRQAAQKMSPGVDLKAANITGDATQGCAAAATAAGTTGVDDLTSTATCFYPVGVKAGRKVIVNISVDVPLLTPIIGQIVGGFIKVSAQSVSYVQ